MSAKKMIIFAVLLISSTMYAQITLDASGNTTLEGNTTIEGYTALGSTPSSSYRLRVSYSSSASTHSGIYATSTGSTGNLYNYAIQGRASGGGYSNFGVYGYATGAAYNWAGYFAGDVYTTGSYQSSDERFKKNIVTVDKKDILEKVGQLNPVSFQFLSEDELTQKGLPSINAREGEHVGLLAQEVEKIFPEFVVDVPQPVNDETEESDTAPQTVTTKAVNYQELSIALLAAVQELKTEVDELKAKLASK